MYTSQMLTSKNIKKQIFRDILQLTNNLSLAWPVFNQLTVTLTSHTKPMISKETSLKWLFTNYKQFLTTETKFKSNKNALTQKLQNNNNMAYHQLFEYLHNPQHKISKTNLNSLQDVKRHNNTHVVWGFEFDNC